MMKHLIDKSINILLIEKLNGKIIFKVGLFCGYAYTQNCINGLLNCMGLNREAVKRVIGWREGGIPGDFMLELKDGRIERMSFIEEHCIDITFYSLLRCHMCVDWSSVYSDVSLGDIGGWKREDLIIVRTTRGEELLQAMNGAERLYLRDLDLEKLARGTPFHFMVGAKMVRSQLFINYLTRLGLSTPKWNVKYKGKSLITRLYSNRYFAELLDSRRKLDFYEQNPQLMKRKGRYIYLNFWNRFLFRVIRKVKRVLLKKYDW